MTIDRMIALLKIEHECMLRKSHGECDGKCEDCELVQDDGELHEMYNDVVGLLETMKGDDGEGINWLKMTRHDMEMFVKDIIRETVRRGGQEMCPYCHSAYQYHPEGSIHGKQVAFKPTASRTDFKDWEIWQHEGETPCVMCFDRGGSGAYIDINYCPMCGRDLRGEADGANDMPG